MAAEAWLVGQKRATQQAALRRQRVEAQRTALATAFEAGDEARVERAAAALEQELGEDGAADRDLSEARAWLDAQRTKRRAEEARQKAERERQQSEQGPSPTPPPIPNPKRSPAGLLVIAAVVIAVVLWATLERRTRGAAKDSTATAILDGERVGMTPKVAPDLHEAKVTRPGWEGAERWLVVLAGQRQRIELEPVCPTTGAPTATASPTSTPRPRPTPIPALRREAGATWVSRTPLLPRGGSQHSRLTCRHDT